MTKEKIMTMIHLKKETRVRLSILRLKLDLKNHDELLNYLLDKEEKSK